jgi:hypothetical protein
MLAACGGSESGSGGLAGPGDLEGRTVAVASLTSVATLELRYVLQEKYVLGPDDVAIAESPGESLIDLVREGEVDAAVLPAQSAFASPDDGTVRVISHLAQEMREHAGAPVVASVLITYPDAAGQKAAALSELNRMLAESRAYARANRDALVNAVAEELSVDPAFVRWLWDRHELRFGDGSQEAQDQLAATWRAGQAVGDVGEPPAVEAVLFEPTGATPTGTPGGDRTTISLALLDDPLRRVALAAVERGIVASDVIDLDVTYLPASALTEAAPARQYDAVEATPLTVPLGIERGFDFLVLSAGAVDVDATLLFARVGPEG